MNPNRRRRSGGTYIADAIAFLRKQKIIPNLRGTIGIICPICGAYLNVITRAHAEQHGLRRSEFMALVGRRER